MKEELGKPVEGINANKHRENREILAKVFGNLDPNCQIIFISTDVTGASPTHVHMQGPSTDGVLIGGMLSEASRIIFKSLDQQRKELKEQIKKMEQRLDKLEKHYQA